MQEDTAETTSLLSSAQHLNNNHNQHSKEKDQSPPSMVGYTNHADAGHRLLEERNDHALAASALADSSTGATTSATVTTQSPKGISASQRSYHVDSRVANLIPIPPSLSQRHHQHHHRRYEDVLGTDPDGNHNHDDDDDDDDATEFTTEDKILRGIDTVQDEWDELTYDQLVPLEIKLALEQTVFGWSHLTSDILGHTVFTGGAAGLTWVLLRQIVPHWTILLRAALAGLAAWSSFCMVRRRRRVWLRAPYGSRRYLQSEAQRRVHVAQVDQLSWTSRLRKRQKVRATEKKLLVADGKFQQHQIMRLQMQGNTNSTAASSPTSLQHQRSPIRDKRRKMSFSTDAVPDMQSVQQDQIVFSNGRINRVPYLHGGGFGAAPFLLANPHWINILRHLMPDVYVEISRRVTNAPPYRLMHWAENNPVVAAYSTAHELEYNGSSPTMEWDVFLDPYLVERVQLVLRERRTYLLSVLPKLPTVKPMEKLPEFEDELTLSQRNVVKYYERELRKRCNQLVDEMLIAHGNLMQLSVEQSGYAKYYNYSRVKRARRTLGGGIFARQWMAVFAESLRVGVLDESPTTSPRSHSPTNSAAGSPGSTGSCRSPSSSQQTTSLLDMAHSVCPNTSIAASIAIVRHICKREDPLGLILDVKSRHIPPQVWACVVDCLRESGVRVEGVGHFVQEEIRSLAIHTVHPIKELMFFHSAGDLQQACHEKRVRYGDTIFFNAGSLLWTPAGDPQRGTCQKVFGSFDAEAIMQSYRLQPYAMPSRRGEASSYSSLSGYRAGSTIQDYKKRYNLSIGLYLQEFAIDEAAANILVQLVNENTQIYDLGLAWGGINGITLRGIRPGRFTDTSGFWIQRHYGALWDSSLSPPV